MPFSAKVQLIRHFTKSWKTLAAALLADVLPLVEKLLAQVAGEVFASHADGRLVSRVQ